MPSLVHHRLTLDGQPLQRDAVGRLLHHSAPFRESIANRLREAPFPAYFLELPVCSPAPLVDALLVAVGAACLAWPDDRPLWLSTSGLGVYWLHVRLDARPKYYTHAPHRVA